MRWRLVDRDEWEDRKQRLAIVEHEVRVLSRWRAAVLSKDPELGNLVMADGTDRMDDYGMKEQPRAQREA